MDATGIREKEATVETDNQRKHGQTFGAYTLTFDEAFVEVAGISMGSGFMSPL